MIRCLIIEDDIKTIETIRSVGNDFSGIVMNEVKEDREVALNFLLKSKPDLVIMNIDSARFNLFEFFFELTLSYDDNPIFIALSASKSKAYDSYQLDFSDFILKPLSEFSIRKCLSKYSKKHPFKQIDTICLKSYKDYQYLNIDNILYLKADNNTTDFFMADGSVIGAYKTLKVFENLLPKTFLRIHKSYIINKNCISRIQYGKLICIIKNEHKIPFTKTFIENVNLINASLSKNNLITLN